MKDKNYTCFLIPVHPPKFHQAKDLIISYTKYYTQNNLYLIFSNKEDENLFKKKYSDLNFYKSIVLNLPDNEGIINSKKLAALYYIFSTTQYKIAAVIDCDCIFIKKINYQRLFEEILNSKIVYASLSSNYYICESPLRFFNEADKNIILKNIKLKEGILYFWFNQIPLYNREEFLEMYEKLNLKQNIINIKWADFEYMLYVYFLLTQNKISIKKINTNKITENSYIESIDLVTHDLLNNIKTINPLWMPIYADFFAINKREYLKFFKNVFIKFHL